MPPKKPVVQVVISNKYLGKLKTLAEHEERSLSQMAAIMIENYIKSYETKHGEIQIEKDQD